MFTTTELLKADYLGHRGDTLTFVSQSRPSSQRLKLALNAGQLFRCRVELKGLRVVNTGSYVCQGRLLEPLDSFKPRVPARAAEFARRKPRNSRRLRLLSPELPSFRALTVDISGHGLQISAEGPLSVGTSLGFTLELDMPGQFTLACRARVAWCRAEGREFRVGLEFQQLPAESRQLLDIYEAWMNGSVLKPSKPPQAETETAVTRERMAEEPKPPAGVLTEIVYRDSEVSLHLERQGGKRFLVEFDNVLLFRDHRGLEGTGFDDALEHRDSDLLRSVRKAQPIALDAPKSFYHYQFLNRAGRAILEVVCLKPVSRQAL